MMFTRESIEELKREPLTDAQKEAAEIVEEFFDALAESDSDGVFETLDPIPEQRPPGDEPPPPAADGKDR